MRRIIIVLALALALSLFSCDAAEKEKAPEYEFESIGGETEFDGEIYDGSEINDLFDLLTREEGKTYAVSSRNFGVDSSVFEALSNVIFRQMKDGSSPNYENYPVWIENGLLDASVNPAAQTVPGADVSWYDDIVAETYRVSELILTDLETAKEKEITLTDKVNQLKLENALAAIGDDASEYGASVNVGDVRTA